MEKFDLKELNQRIEQLEKLAWSLFRALETYITYNDLHRKGKEDETDDGHK